MKRRLAVGAGAVLAAAAWSHWWGRAVRRQVPQDGRIVALGAARLHVVELGEGPAVLMIHGLSGQLRNFGFALAGLVAAGGYRVVLVDRPGYGYSVAPGRPGIAEQAAMLAQLVGTLELDRPLVVGHSMGGAVALAMALDHPAATGGLALLAPLTHPAGRVPGWARHLVGTGPARLAWAHLLGAPLVRIGEPWFKAAIFAPEPVPDGFAIRGGGRLALRPGSLDQAQAEVAGMDAAMAAMVPRYPELRLPVALLAPRQDAVIPAAEHAQLAAALIPGARLELVDGGHMLPITQPERCAAFIAAAYTSSTSRP